MLTMNSSTIITIFGTSVVVYYSILKIFEFYNIDVKSYGAYVNYYIFLLITIYLFQVV